MDKISIIVVFRDRDVIRVQRFLESLNHQDNRNFELIFIDNGSDTVLAQQVRQIVNTYDFANYYYNDSRGKDFNKSIALNIGAELAVGDYFYFVDVDLMFSQGFIDHIYKLRNANAHIYTRVFMINESFQEYEELGEKKDFEEFSVLSSTSGRGIVMMPKKVFFEIGGYDEYYTDWGLEDNDMYVRLKAYGLKEVWAYDERFPVFHQWHPSNERFHFFPEKWLDEITFYAIINQNKPIRNNVGVRGLVDEGKRNLMNCINSELGIPTIHIPLTGLYPTKTLYYRTIWEHITDKNIKVFKIIVPNYCQPKLSIFHTLLSSVFKKILILTKSPFSLKYFQTHERHKYFLPEVDIKWLFRKIVKEPNLIKDYYIEYNQDETIYYVENIN